MRAFTLFLGLITPVFIYSQLTKISFTVENTFALILIVLLSISLFIAALAIGDK